MKRLVTVDRQTARKKTSLRQRQKKSKKKTLPPTGSDGQLTAQESEYQNLLKRVEAGKDAAEVKKIAKQIEREP